MRWPLLLVACAAPACTHRPLSVAPGELHRHVPELRRTGRAQVELTGGGTLDVTVDQLATLGGDRYAVRKLIADCPDVPPFREDRHRRTRPCLLTDRRDDALHFGTRRQVDGEAVKTVVNTTLVLGGLVGLGVCAGVCPQPWSAVSGVTLGAAGVGLLLIGFALGLPGMAAFH